MKKQFLLLFVALLLATLSSWATTTTVKLYSTTASTVGGIGISTEHLTGTGSWKPDPATSKMELYLPLTSLGTFTIDDIEKLEYSTKKSLPIPTTPNLDFFWSIYTVGNTHGWYNERLTSEPMYYNNYNAPYDVWTTFQTDGLTNKMTFFNSNLSPIGYSNAPTLADLQTGAINFNYTSPYWTVGTGIDYGAQTVLTMSLSTGSGTNAIMLSYLDNIIITLNNGNVLIVDLEEKDPTPTTTIQSPVSSSCGSYDVPVTVSDFKNVGAISMKLDFNASVLGYQTPTGVDINPAISSADYDVSTPGKFNLGWNSLAGITLADNAVLFTLHFNLPTAIASGTTNNFIWSETPGDCEIAGPGGAPVYTSTFTDKAWSIPTRPVKSVRSGLEYCTIQAAIDAAGAWDEIQVAAGTYAENLTINKELVITGPNANNSGCGSRVAEAVIVPATNSPADWSSQLVLLTASGITIKGFTFDGDNPSLGGTGDYNVSQGIVGWSGQANISIRNNIIKNLATVGVGLADDNAVMTSGNIIDNNKFDNINPTGGFGIGIYTGNNTYVDIKSNCMTNVRKGIQGGENNHKANTGNVSPIWSGNTIQSYKIGIWNNLAYTDATPVTITENAVTTVPGSTINSGIEISSIQTAVNVYVTNNTVTGAMAGINLWNNTTSATVTVGVNTFTDCDYGVFVNNFDGYNSNAVTSPYVVNGAQIVNPKIAGLYVKDNSLNTNSAKVSLQVQGNTTVTGTQGTAFLVEGADATLSFAGTLPASVIGTPKYITLRSNTIDVPAGNIDATGVSFDGSLGSSKTDAQLFATEDKIDHKIDLSTLGFVTVKANNDYVTVNSFVAPNISPLVQRAIDAASPAWTVNVGPGTFDNSMDIIKPLTVLGQGKTLTFLDRSANATAGNVVDIHNLAGDVKVDGFSFKTGPASTVASNGISISNLTGPGTITITNNEVWGFQSATATAEDNFGLIAGYFSVTTPKLVFDHNTVHGGSDNPILIEQWMGQTEITNNSLYQNPLKDFSASDVIFMMNHDRGNNTAKQLISGNTIDMGWGTTNQRGAGITVASSYTGGTTLGGFTNVEISNNLLLNLKPNRRGISTYNNSSDGTGGDILNALISGNEISNAIGFTGEFGIRVLGKATGTQITNNLISGVTDAVKIQPWNSHEPIATTVNSNSFLAVNYGINNLTAATIEATCNWYGTIVASGIAAKISGPATYTPWLTIGVDGSGDPGFQPSGSCDNILPSITIPDDITVNQHGDKDPYSTGIASGDDNSGVVSITYNDNRSGLNLCNATGVIIRTWTATDEAGNSVSANQSITVVDVDSPVIVVPANITVNTDPGLCTAVVSYTNPTATDFGFFQGFENAEWLSGGYLNNPSTDWNEYNSPIARVETGTDGINSKTGEAHGYVNSTILPSAPGDYSGIFSRLGGYSSSFGNGFVSSVDVYLNLDDPNVATSTYGFDVSTAASKQNGDNLRDFIFHAAGEPGKIVIAASNNSNFARRGDLSSLNHYDVTSTGWYTLKWTFRNNSGVLAVDCQLLNAGGSVLWTETRTAPTDLIASVVGGNRYMWFTFIAADKLAIDNTTLTRNLAVTPASLSGTAFAKGTTVVSVSTVDACGHPASSSFTVTVVDAEAPVITTCAPAQSKIVTNGCSVAMPDFTLTTIATDNCGFTLTQVPAKETMMDFANSPYTVTVTATDEAGNHVSCTTTFTVLKASISGTLTYNNVSHTPMNKVKLGLYNSSDVQVGSDVTTAEGTGAYSFPDLCADTYTIKVKENKKDIGGINATDASAANLWVAQGGSIEYVQFLAGDVADNNLFINNQDALRIQKFFVYGTAFDRAPWSYWKKGNIINNTYGPFYSNFNVTVSGENVTNFDLLGMCTGDFNGSLIPTTLKSATWSMELANNSMIYAGASQEFELPVRSASAMQVGAISMILRIPSGLVNVQDILVNGSAVAPDWAVNGDELRIGWYSSTPVNVAENGNLLTMKLKSTSAFTIGQTMEFALKYDPLNELANANSEAIQGASLLVAQVGNGLTGIHNPIDNTGLSLSNYPNPFKGTTTVDYKLPTDGKVTIQVYNSLGQVVKSLVNANQKAGDYSVQMDGNNLMPGIYIAKLRLTNLKMEMTGTIKLSVLK